MAENEPVTPEQQLLKLIEGQDPGAPSKRGPAKPKGRGFSPAALRGAVLGSLSFWKRRSAKRAAGRRSAIGIAELNKVLALTVAGLFLYVLFDAVASARNLQKPPSFAPMKDLRGKPAKDGVAPLADTAYYLQKISARDIFKEGRREAAPAAEAPVQKQAEESEVVKNLSLVGISWSSNPDAIIEDKTAQRTYFVKRGQEAGDGVRVEAIFRDHVIVSHEDREYELR